MAVVKVILENEHGVVLPHRGIIHDRRQTLTHNTVIIKQFFQNALTPESPDGHRIAKKLVTGISKRLRKCGSSSKTGVPLETIASDLGNESPTRERIYCHNRGE
jgi:hypothetical protein